MVDTVVIFEEDQLIYGGSPVDIPQSGIFLKELPKSTDFHELTSLCIYSPPHHYTDNIFQNT